MVILQITRHKQALAILEGVLPHLDNELGMGDVHTAHAHTHTHTHTHTRLPLFILTSSPPPPPPSPPLPLTSNRPDQQSACICVTSRATFRHHWSASVSSDTRLLSCSQGEVDGYRGNL